MRVHAPMVSMCVFFLFRAASQNRQSFGNTDTDDDNDDNNLQVCLHVKVSCFRIEVSTGWVCVACVLFLHCYSILFH